MVVALLLTLLTPSAPALASEYRFAACQSCGATVATDVQNHLSAFPPKESEDISAGNGGWLAEKGNLEEIALKKPAAVSRDSEAKNHSIAPILNGSSKGVVIFDIDDVQVGWLENTSISVVQVNIDENVDLLVNVIPYQIGSSNLLALNLKAWNTNQQGLIEIGQHGYNHTEYLDALSYDKQKTIVEKGLAELNSIVIQPKSFTPAFGNQNTDTLDVLAGLGFHTDLDCWVGLSSTANIVVLKQCECLLCDQWGVSGPQCNLKSRNTLMSDVDNAINNSGYAVVAFHMQDFSTADGNLDYTKLDQYRQILKDLKNSGKYVFMTPDEYCQTLNPLTPKVTTNAATSITTDSATLNGYLNSLGTASSVQVSFQWGITTAYGSETIAQTMIAAGPFSANLTGLTPGTTYHFRAKAVGTETSYGRDLKFRCPRNPKWRSLGD